MKIEDRPGACAIVYSVKDDKVLMGLRSDTCGAEIDDIKDFHVNSRGYCCKKCFNE